MKTKTDPYIISSLKSGSKEKINQALKIIYDQSFEKIKLHVINNSGDEIAAEDLFQDGIVVFYQNILNNKFREDSKVETYIFSICKNLWRQYLRSTKKQNEQILSLHHQNTLDEDHLLDYNLLKDVLNELKEDCRKILKTFYFDNKSIKEVQHIFNMNSEQVVKNKKARCLSYLMNLIEKRRLSKADFYYEYK